MNGESRFTIATNVAGAVCGPTVAFSWEGEDSLAQPYTPWSHFYVPADRSQFAITLQVTARNVNSTKGLTYRYFPPAELVIRDPTDSAVDSVTADSSNRDLVTDHVATNNMGGLWSFRIHSPSRMDRYNPPQLEVAFDDSLPEYVTWLQPERFFMPVTMPGLTRMGRGSVTEHWSIGIPVPYVCTAQIRGSGERENPPAAAEQSLYDSDHVDLATSIPRADSLGLWAGARQPWTYANFAGDSARFYILQTPSNLSSQGMYLDPSTKQPRHVVELSAGSAHCDTWYRSDTCAASLNVVSRAQWQETYAREHYPSYTATHGASYAQQKHMLVSVRLDLPHYSNGVPVQSDIEADLDTLYDDVHGPNGLTNLWAYETGDWMLSGFDRDWMLQEAYQIRRKDAALALPLDLGEGPTDLKMNRELGDIADVRGTWSYPRQNDTTCAGNTCKPLCDIIQQWDDLARDRPSNLTFAQGISLYHQAGFGPRSNFVDVAPDTTANQALASLMLGAAAVREWVRYDGPDDSLREDQVEYHDLRLWRAMISRIPAMLDQVATWLDAPMNDTPNFGRGGSPTTECGGPSIVYGDGDGYFVVGGGPKWGVWLVVCNLGLTGAAKPDSIVLPWSQLHDLPSGNYTITNAWKNESGPEPVWTAVPNSGIRCKLYGTAFGVAFIPYPEVMAVNSEKAGDVSQVTVSPVPVTGTARVQFYARAEGQEEVILTDVTGRDVLRKEIPGRVGWNDWIWNGDLDRGHAAAGVYFLRLKSSDGKVTRRRLVVCR